LIKVRLKPTIKETLSILDKQHPVETNIYTGIKEASFKGIADNPMLFTALSRLLVNYESEWYSEIDAEGKLPEWEELNSEMTEDAKNLLGYLQTGDEAKFEAYLSSVGKAKDSPEAKGFETLRREISRFPADYKESPSEKLTKAQFESYAKMEALEKQVTAWEKTKEKIKKMLWWEDVAKGLAKLNQQNDTPPENGETTNTTTPPTDSAPPATLSADGRAWFIHPVALFNFKPKFCITVDMLKQIFTSVSNNRRDLLQFIVNDINVHMNKYKLDTPLRLSHFFAQIRQEVGLSLQTEENFTYSVSGLKTTYKYFKNNPEDAIKHGYPDGSPKNLRTVSEESQKFVANKAMGDRLGNLGSDTDDGWNFRGRGLKQLTGRDNYVDFANGYQEIWGGEYINFVDNPDLLHTNYKYIVHSGVYFWLKYKLYNIADQGSDESTVNLITAKINQHTKSYKDRYNHFKEIYDDKKIFQNI
jgi:predicted chitinase